MGRWRAFRPYAVVALLNASEGMITLLVPPYLANIGFAPTAIGLIVASYGVACFVSRLPAGALYRGDRARALLGSALLSAAIISLVYPLATDSWSLLLVRVMHGLAYGLATTINLALFIDLLPANAPRHHAMGYFSAALGGGFTVGQAIGGLAGQWFGYGWAFALAALPPLLALALVDAPRATAAPRPARPAAAPGLRGRFRAGLRDGLQAFAAPGIAAIALLGFFLAFFLNLTSTFMPLFALMLGFGLAEIGLIRSAHSVCNSITRPFSGGFIARVGHARIGAGCLAFNVVALVLLPSMTTLLTLAGLMIAVGLVRGIGMVANTVSVAADVDETRVSRGLASGIYYGSRDLGGIAGPVAGGLVAGLVGIEDMFRIVPIAALVVYFLVLMTSERVARRNAAVSAASS